ncbi:MAG: hypothetical protein IJ373_05010 [Clostridia bacterium]|nr:hypothetical protein [Clostridia bacterium]
MLTAAADETAAAPEWKAGAASDAVTIAYDDNGYAAITSTGWGSRVYNVDPVKLDGLKLSLYTESTSGTWYGLGLVNPGDAHNDYAPGNNYLDIHIRPGQYEGQTRINTTTNHDGASAVIASKTLEDALASPQAVAGAGLGSITLAQTEGVIDVTYEFDYIMTSDVYAITVTINQGALHSVQKASVVQYVPASYISGALNGDGEAVFSVYGAANTTLKVKFEEEVIDPVAPVENKEWATRGTEATLIAQGTKVEYEADTGWNVFYGHSSYGIASANKHKVKVDGLVVEIYTDTFTNNGSDYFGFSFVKNIDSYGSETANTYHNTLWPGLHGQGRFVTSYSHDHSKGIAYKTADAVKADNSDIAGTFWSSIVMNNPTVYGFKVSFSAVEGTDVYQVVVEMTHGEKFGQQGAFPQTMYFHKQYVENAMGDDGLVYLSAFGSTSNPDKPVFKIRYSDENSRAYEAGALATAETAVAAYEAAVASVADNGIDAASTAKEAAVAALAGLWENDVAAYEARVAAANATLDAAIEAQYEVVTIPQAIEKEDGAKVKVSGTVSAINTAWSEQYGNITVTIVDAEGNSLYVYRMKTNVAVGDIITIKGEMGSYNGSKQVAAGSTAEITGHDSSYDYTEMTILEAIAAEDNTNVIVTGTVAEIKTAYSEQYGNISVDIADDEGNRLYLYRLAGNVEVGQIIKVKGAMATYKGNRQLTGGTYEVVGTHECTNYADGKCIVCGADEPLPEYVEVYLQPGDNTITMAAGQYALAYMRAALKVTFTWTGEATLMAGRMPIANGDVVDYNPMMGAITITPVNAEAECTVVLTVAEYVEPVVPAQKLELGANAVTVTVEAYYCEGTEVEFTATEAGEYVLKAAEGEENADIGMPGEYGYDWITLPYTFTLAEGETVKFIVCTTAYMTLTEDTIDLVLEKVVEEEPDDSSSEPTTSEPADSSDEPTTSEPADSSDEPTTSEPEEEKKGGCGSVIGGVSAALTLIAAAAIVMKKKED